MRSDNTKRLDAVLNCVAFGRTSCRKLILDLQWPLVPKGNEKVSRLFHSVDFSASGRNAEKETFFTAFKDGLETAEQIAAVLPHFLDFITVSQEQEASSLWCMTPSNPTEAKAIDWELDDKGEWSGQWVTEGDRDPMFSLNEDMGHDFKIENLDMVKGDKPTRVLTAEELSCQSFALASVAGK